MKCSRPIRDTVYTLIMEEKVGNISNNLSFREHVTILKIKLFVLFSSSCLSSMTHEMLTPPRKLVIDSDQPLAFKGHQARVSVLRAQKHKTPSLHLIILWVLCMTVFCLQTWFSIISPMPTTNSAPADFFNLEKKVCEWIEDVEREVSSSWTVLV